MWRGEILPGDDGYCLAGRFEKGRASNRFAEGRPYRDVAMAGEPAGIGVAAGPVDFCGYAEGGGGEFRGIAACFLVANLDAIPGGMGEKAPNIALSWCGDAGGGS